MSPSPSPPDPAIHAAGMIARAERRRAALEDLSVVGMALAKEIAHRNIEGPYHPEPRHDPGRSFASASRAVRLTLVMEAKVDERILAMCKGDFTPVEATRTLRMAFAAAPTVWNTGFARPRPARADLDEGTAERDLRESENERLVDSEHADIPRSRSFGGVLPPVPEVESADTPTASQAEQSKPTPTSREERHLPTQIAASLEPPNLEARPVLDSS